MTAFFGILADIIYIRLMVTALSVLTLIANVLLVLLVLGWIIKKTQRFASLGKWINRVHEYVRKHALEILFIISLIATAGSLYFSEIRGWTPCKLCWWQRIFMYPQVIVLAMALYKKSRDIIAYLIPLSVIGAVIAAFHYAEQLQARLAPANSLVPCDASGISCAATPIFHFGYITIPVMALSAFLLILAVCAITRKRANS